MHNKSIGKQTTTILLTKNKRLKLRPVQAFNVNF